MNKMATSTKAKTTNDPVSNLEKQVKELAKQVKDQAKQIANIDQVVEAKIKVTNFKMRKAYLQELLDLQNTASGLVGGLTKLINKVNVKNLMSEGELHLLSMHPDYLYREVAAPADGTPSKIPSGSGWQLNKFISGPNAAGRECTYWMRKK